MDFDLLRAFIEMTEITTCFKKIHLLKSTKAIFHGPYIKFIDLALHLENGFIKIN